MKKMASNYRPISLTSIVGKLMETILRNQIVKHLEAYNLISDSQHGFRRGRSCLTNLLYFYEDIHDMVDNKKPVDIIYLDFEKAFDKVPHKRLIAKLKSHGINGDICTWVEDWLSNRKQRVVVNGKESPWSSVCSGVPQGSVLGPILFTIYINDIDTDLKCNVSKFADDTKLGYSCETTEDCNIIQEDLHKICQWSEKWQMSFNVDKCKVMHIGKDNNNYQYTMNNRVLQTVTEEKDLGVIFSNDMKTSKQCTAAANKANRMLGLIYRTFTFKNQSNMIQLYKSLVRPHLEYAIQAWAPYLQKDKNRLESVQRRATRFVPALRNKPYETRLSDSNLFSLSYRRKRGDLIEIYKIFNKINDVELEPIITLNQNGLRGNGLKIVLKGTNSNSSIRMSTFSRRTPQHWNSLSSHIVGAPSLQAFKSRLDRRQSTVPGASWPFIYNTANGSNEP